MMKKKTLAALLLCLAACKTDLYLFAEFDEDYWWGDNDDD